VDDRGDLDRLGARAEDRHHAMAFPVHGGVSGGA
jgi:hypothetical protein